MPPQDLCHAAEGELREAGPRRDRSFYAALSGLRRVSGLFRLAAQRAGPGGTYWDHPEYYQRDRPLFRKYQPLVKQIAAAGWEPLTLARPATGTLHVERFGRAYFAALNDSDLPLQTALSIDADKLELPGGDLVLFDEVAGRHLPYHRQAASIVVALEMPPRSVSLLHIATKADFVAQHWDAAARLFRRPASSGKRMKAARRGPCTGT